MRERKNIKRENEGQVILLGFTHGDPNFLGVDARSNREVIFLGYLSFFEDL